MPAVQNPLVRAMIVLLLLLPSSASSQQLPESYTGPPSRAEILASPRWRQAERKFNEWLSIQKIYNEAQVAQVKAQLQQKIKSMSATQLEDFMTEAEEKLSVLLSDQAMAARTSMSYYTDSFLKKQFGQAPDVANMTTSQLRQELGQFKQWQTGRASAQSAFNKMQDQNAAAVLQERTQQRAALDAQRLAIRNPSNYAWNYNYGPRPYPNVRSPYAPGFAAPPRPQFTVSPWGGVWRSLP